MLSITWYLNRFRAMSLDEIFFRLSFQFKKWHWKNTLKKGSVEQTANWSVEPNQKKNWPKQDLNSSDKEAQLLIKEAVHYLNHEWLFFGLKNISEEEIDWHTDPVSGIKAPLKFGYSINHRDENLVGNIKLTWEKNRHHHLTVLAVAYHLTGEEKYAEEVIAQLQSWIKQNPYLVGVNWTHPLEQGIRLISWVWCERLLRSSKSYEKLVNKDSGFWDSAYQHQLFIEKTYSRGSSANNHLIGEMAGLFIASTAWPWFDKSKKWKKLSKRILEKEIQKQTFESGINKEMAFSYHIFVLEFYLLAVFEANQNDESFSKRTEDYLKKMIKVIPELTDIGGNLPNYGDGDEGMAIQLQSLEGRRDNWLLQLGDSLLDTSTKADQDFMLPFLLFKQEYGATNRNSSTDLKSSIGYTDAGIFVMTEERNSDNELFVIADAGPLGFLSIAAHGHADTLSFTMSYGGVPFFIDPGTYVYHTDYKWRKYFRGTSAHNTITLNGLDQSEQAGAFLWTDKAETFVKKWDSKNNILTAFHDGYKKRLNVIHQRKLELNESALFITDQLTGDKVNFLEMRFHLHPDCVLKEVPNGYLIQNSDKKLQIEFPENWEYRLAVGEQNAGWYSPSFDKKVETSTIILTKQNINLPAKFKTIIKTIKT